MVFPSLPFLSNGKMQKRTKYTALVRFRKTDALMCCWWKFYKSVQTCRLVRWRYQVLEDVHSPVDRTASVGIQSRKLIREV